MTIDDKKVEEQAEEIWEEAKVDSKLELSKFGKTPALKAALTILQTTAMRKLQARFNALVDSCNKAETSVTANNICSMMFRTIGKINKEIDKTIESREKGLDKKTLEACHVISTAVNDRINDIHDVLMKDVSERVY